ncbi:MAG: M23 family metallopeptidase [Candidatus Bipolaricaulota bacterium]
MSKDAALAALLGLLVLPLLLVPFLPPEDMGGPSTSVLDGRPLPYETYTVRDGDSFASIAARYDIPLSYLLASNPGKDPDRLRPGEVLVLPDSGVVHTLRSGQTLDDLAATYGVEVGSLEWKGPGAEPQAGDQVFVPRPSTVPQAEAVRLGAGQAGRFIWPLRGRISSPFGWRVHPIRGGRHLHSGLDIAVPEGTPVHAAAAGRVSMTGWSGEYGVLVMIRHTEGYSTYYAHLSQAKVQEGQYVEQAQVLGLSGNTGMSTGPHLHFEIREGSVPVDPELYLP